MKETEVYGFTYPECAPPLVKDASQIAQVRVLADEFDAEVERAVTQANIDLISPPATRFAINIVSLPVVTTDNLVSPVFDQQVFAVNWGDTPPLVFGSGDMRIDTPGWYLVGCHAVVETATAAVLPMVRLTVNGSPASSWSPVAGNYGTAGNTRIAALSAVPLALREDDRVRMQIQHLAAGSPSWNYRPHLWAVRLVSV